jgi:hypothetical protein
MPSWCSCHRLHLDLVTVADDENVLTSDPEAELEARLFSTHPPLRDRVALASRFRGSPEPPSDTRPVRLLIESLLA